MYSREPVRSGASAKAGAEKTIAVPMAAAKAASADLTIVLAFMSSPPYYAQCSAMAELPVAKTIFPQGKNNVKKIASI
jgi:hypothetical protein